MRRHEYDVIDVDDDDVLVDLIVCMYDCWWGVRSRQMLLLTQSSEPNELIFKTMFYDSACLEGTHG